MFIRKHFLKNNTLFILGIFLLFLLLTFPAYQALLHPGLMTGHDTEGHLIRLFEFDKALSDEHFPVRWAKRLNNGLGYPFFNYNYPLIYYLGEILYKTGLGLTESIKALFLISFPLSGFFAFLWFRQRFGGLNAIIGAFFYTVVPYHFLNVYVRGNLGETVALTILPLSFYFIEKLYKNKSNVLVVSLALVLAGIITSHNLTAMIFLPIILCYGLLLNFWRKDWRYLTCLFFSFALSLFLSAFFWLPALWDKKLVRIDEAYNAYLFRHFPSLKSLIYSPWGFGLSKVGLEKGEMSFQIGILHQLVFVLSLSIVIFRARIDNKKSLVVLFILTTLGSILLMQEFSKPVWELLSPLQYMQFPWRLLSVVVVSLSFLTALTFSVLEYYLKNRVLFILIILATILSLLYINRNHWRVNEYYPVPARLFLDVPFGGTTTPEGEHVPKWLSPEAYNSTNRYEIVKSEARVESIVWKTNYHLFSVSATSAALISDRTVYFPGWEVFVDGQKVQVLKPTKDQTKGLITFWVSEGKHQVEVKLAEPVNHKIGNILTLAGLVIVAFLLITYYKVTKVSTN